MGEGLKCFIGSVLGVWVFDNELFIFIFFLGINLFCFLKGFFNCLFVVLVFRRMLILLRGFLNIWFLNIRF